MIIDMQKAIKNKTAHPDDTPTDVKIAIKDLNLYYGAFHALHGINLDIERGKITAFIGPSGCGKSTLLKTLNRMNDLIPDCRVEGSITLDGENIYGSMDVNLLRKRVGMVFQKPNPFPMSVYDNIAYGPAHAWHPPQGTAGRNCGKQPAERRHLGRAERPPEQERFGAFRRAAAAALHCARAGG